MSTTTVKGMKAAQSGLFRVCGQDATFGGQAYIVGVVEDTITGFCSLGHSNYSWDIQEPVTGMDFQYYLSEQEDNCAAFNEAEAENEGYRYAKLVVTPVSVDAIGNFVWIGQEPEGSASVSEAETKNEISANPTAADVRWAKRKLGQHVHFSPVTNSEGEE